MLLSQSWESHRRTSPCVLPERVVPCGEPSEWKIRLIWWDTPTNDALVPVTTPPSAIATGTAIRGASSRRQAFRLSTSVVYREECTLSPRHFLAVGQPVRKAPKEHAQASLTRERDRPEVPTFSRAPGGFIRLWSLPPSLIPLHRLIQKVSGREGMHPALVVHATRP
jgi:hypothetical protein